MSDRPTERAWQDRPLRVAIETEPGNRDFQIDPRCEVVELLIGSDDQISRAVIDVWPGPTTPSAGSEDALRPGDVLNEGDRPGFGMFISPDQEIFIVRERATVGDDIWEPYFSGYCELPSYREQTTQTGAAKSFQLHVEGMLSRLSDMDYAQIVGRRMRSAAAQDALDTDQGRGSPTPHLPSDDEEEEEEEEEQAQTDVVVVVSGRPCIFNAEGKSNCARSQVPMPFGEGTVNIPVFTHDGDPNATPWTWAKALRYLVYWHLYCNPTGDPSGELITDGNVFDLTDDLTDDEQPASRPKPPAGYEQAWQYAALGLPANFSVDCMNVAEALIQVADAAGMHFWVRTELDEFAATTTPVNKLYFWARGAGTIKDLHREGDSPGMSAQAILEANDVNNLTVRMDYRDLLPAPKVVGDVRRYEITTELVPGWLPDENLDDVGAEYQEEGQEEELAAALAAALAYALEHQGIKDDPAALAADPWYQKYHRSGSQSNTFAPVGRRWVLNASGLYAAKSLEDDEEEEGEKKNLYARTVGPFDVDAYAPWEPSDCGIGDTFIDDAGVKGTAGLTAGYWTRCPRPFLPCFSADKEGRSLGVVVEVSFDAGSTWHRVQNLNTRALTDDSGVYFDADDLTDIYAPGDPGGPSFWEAYLYGTALVRVTCVIEGDERVQPNLNASLFAPPGGANLSRLFDMSDKFKSNRRDGGNSLFARGVLNPAPSQTDDTRDDIVELQAYAENLLEICSARQQAGMLQAPWLTKDWLPGDSIRSITGLGFDFNAHALTAQRRYPDVVGVVFSGRQTSIMLDDFRFLEEVSLLPTTRPPDAAVYIEPMALATPGEYPIAMV